jgi:hypothetical protein
MKSNISQTQTPTLSLLSRSNSSSNYNSRNNHVLSELQNINDYLSISNSQLKTELRKYFYKTGKEGALDKRVKEFDK